MTDPNVLSTVRVPLVEEAAAEGRTKELYDAIKSRMGIPFVPDMFRLVSSRPDLLEVVIAGYGGVFNDGVLPRATRELISAWSSRVNGCPYCVGTHNWFLAQFGGSQELTDAVEGAASVEELPIDERTKVLMRLVTKVGTGAFRITDEDWAATEAAGWSNGEMLEAVFTAALFAFINRLVDGLGLGNSVTRSRIASQPEDATVSAERLAEGR
ncbi:putative peroxidase-related enzyme [Kitasatospora sp. SolWspMP-SS2h]|uniref:carboxymuconolactone decarboxylase family protein n=1 Tax=Kitasatospora sp. SolWspMP-SS2h TaxID=1305729 RepID=UPI000DBA634A|nr:peroxidase-related enzyme [Kitasatospora sp. SolWspMP-SS2h]RAJ45434.1 putative peroxidase-related enzyme [Kitasatospora sp. SolWspMP-SS2h]